jgi:hypothetical protein
MKQLFPKFVKNLLIFSALLAISVWGITFLVPSRYLTPTLPYQFIFFLALTIIVSLILLKVSKERFAKFLNAYLLLTTVKLLLFFVIIGFYIYRNRADAMPFTITFLFLYICFSIFEVVSLVTYLKKSS